jgi:hypothetical protein
VDQPVIFSHELAFVCLHVARVVVEHERSAGIRVDRRFDLSPMMNTGYLYLSNCGSRSSVGIGMFCREVAGI